ncbi:hypothetical protein TELCIR_01855 [Teladorsagia circumcincta]|uniref:WD domain, G-beta repeat protein n=1 Tax=Teladorsagia circumcincta TaxID=45464 RepID=A0A2G9V0T5_TELCI|nr:hypothetical protein TELCIR_01855 [Teladorsagia circumcincta]
MVYMEKEAARDLVATGSDDGELKLWKIAADFKSISQVFAYEVPGFINDVRFSADGSMLAIAAGQEHRDGRWWVSAGSVLPFIFTNHPKYLYLLCFAFEGFIVMLL